MRPSDPPSFTAGLLLAPLLWALLWALPAGCSDEPGGTAAAAAPPRVARTERSSDPRVAALRQAIEEGRVDLARGLLEDATADLDVEAHLLRARLEFLAGEATAWGRALEQARLAAPADPRVWATAAELHAAAGNAETAERELRGGLQRCGAAPELERARGVLFLMIPGGAQQGLGSLERALDQDPDLPFVSRALGQAHLLVGRECMRAGEKPAALEHARASLLHDPEDRGAREFLGDVLMVVGEWGEALAVFEALLADGYEEYRAPLAGYYQSAGVWAMTQQNRELTLRYCLAARETGMADEHLGHCANVLDEHAGALAREAREAAEGGDAARARSLANDALRHAPGHAGARAELASLEVQAGFERLTAADLDAAIFHLEAALALDPGSMEAHHFLGQAYFDDGDAARAAKEWQWVVDTSRAEKLELPEPVHLKLARAQALDGDFAASRATLDAYLLFEPTGAYVEVTRQVLAKLPEAPADEDAAGSGDGD